jgi:rubrerythrin
LATTHPHLAKQWHTKKNGDLSPFEVTYGSEKKVWWIGDCGHEWESTVANRVHGNGCPICKNTTISKKVSHIHLSKSGSLKDTHPKLADEWHPEKNDHLLPDQLTAGSTKLVWWVGKCGHEWRASPSNRSRGTNCPYCSNQKVLRGFNDLETLFPEIALEWHPYLNGDLLPTNVIGTSNIKVWWQGKCGHEWQQIISNRTNRKQGCPICAKRMQTSFPEQALFYYIKKAVPDAINTYEELFDNQMELDIYIPSLRIGIEYDGANWHTDNDSYRKEKEKYSICQKNGIKLIRVRENAANSNSVSETSDFNVTAHRHPSPQELDVTILEVLQILGVVVDVDTKADAISIREGYLSRVTANSLLTKRPDIAATWHPTRNGNLTPDMFTVRSGIKVWWVCLECGYEWETAIATRSAGVGCKLCGHKKRAASRIRNRMAIEGSLADNNAHLAEDWHPRKNGDLLPNDVVRSSGKRVWWLCKVCGHEWEATVNSRDRGNGCPQCAKKKQVNPHAPK